MIKEECPYSEELYVRLNDHEACNVFLNGPITTPTKLCLYRERDHTKRAEC